MLRRVRRAPLYPVIAAGGFSRLGNTVAGVALQRIVLTLTDSAALTAVIAAAGIIPLVLGAFFCGPVVDRAGSRNVAVAADLIGASPSLLTPSPCWTHRP